MKKIVIIVLVVILVVGTVVGLSVGLTVGKKDKDDKEQNGGEFADLTYCAFGDSITYGANYLDGYKQMANPYPKLVADTLGVKSYKNAGVSGATLVSNAGGRACVAEIVKSTSERYDIVSVMAGVNDYGASTPLGVLGDKTTETVFGSLDVIANQLKTNMPNAFVFFMTPYQCAHSGSCLNKNGAGYNLLDVANAVKAVANVYDIPVLDMFNDGQYEKYGMYRENSDKLHPNQDFMTQYTAPQIVEFIRANYGK